MNKLRLLLLLLKKRKTKLRPLLQKIKLNQLKLLSLRRKKKR